MFVAMTALALLAALLTSHVPMPPPPPADGGVVTRPPSAAELDAASMQGRYRTLLKVLEVREDGATYGEVRDWGFWSGTEYAGVKDLPKGYWVYVHPRWYIWKDRTSAPPPPKPPSPAELEKASVGGKYSQLLDVLFVPEDQATYGAFTDYGYSDTTSYRDVPALHTGYWVYLAPRWFIFGQVARGAGEHGTELRPRPPPSGPPSFGLHPGAPLKPARVEPQGK